ncbi:MAG: PH domain-containing protein [Pseudomonadota bacterium]
MKTLDDGGWHRTSPWAILFFAAKIIKFFVNNAWQALAPLFAYVYASQQDVVTSLIIGGIAALIGLVVFSVLSYLMFRFRVGQNSIFIREGVLKKTQLDIKFERIQGINTKQNPVYRALKLVTVSFDTAGSAGSEGNLPAVTREFADSIRQRVSTVEKVTEDVEPTTDADIADLPPLLQLDWRDMIRIGLADRRALIVFAFIGGTFEQFQDTYESWIMAFATRMFASGADITAVQGVTVFVAIASVVVLIFVLLSVGAAFLRYHNYALYLDGRRLRSVGGLFTRHEHSMDLEKIQTLRLNQGIVQRWLRRYRLTARQAKSSDHNRASKSFDIPVVNDAQSDELRAILQVPEGGRLTQVPRDPSFQPVSAFYMRSILLYAGAFPALLAMLVTWPVVGARALIVFLWLVPVSLVAYRRWKRAGYLHDDEEIVRRSGFLGYRTSGLLFRKVQRVTIKQSRYQRRKGLATLRMQMASGGIYIPYIPQDVAMRLRDYILYKVESSTKAWH